MSVRCGWPCITNMHTSRLPLFLLQTMALIARYVGWMGGWFRNVQRKDRRQDAHRRLQWAPAKRCHWLHHCFSGKCHYNHSWTSFHSHSLSPWKQATRWPHSWELEFNEACVKQTWRRFSLLRSWRDEESTTAGPLVWLPPMNISFVLGTSVGFRPPVERPCTFQGLCNNILTHAQ